MTRVNRRPHGLFRLTWPLFWRPLHDALIEDSLTRAQRCTLDVPASPISGPNDGSYCTSDESHAAIKMGAPVVVTNVDDEVLATSTLTLPRTVGDHCRFGFVVSGLPEGEAAYVFGSAITGGGRSR